MLGCTMPDETETGTETDPAAAPAAVGLGSAGLRRLRIETDDSFGSGAVSPVSPSSLLLGTDIFVLVYLAKLGASFDKCKKYR